MNRRIARKVLTRFHTRNLDRDMQATIKPADVSERWTTFRAAAQRWNQFTNRVVATTMARARWTVAGKDDPEVEVWVTGPITAILPSTPAYSRWTPASDQVVYRDPRT